MGRGKCNNAQNEALDVDDADAVAAAAFADTVEWASWVNRCRGKYMLEQLVWDLSILEKKTRTSKRILFRKALFKELIFT